MSPFPDDPKRRTRLLTLQQVEAEYGIAYGTLWDLAHTPISRDRPTEYCLKTFRPPGVRRIYVDRVDLDAAIEAWKRDGGI